MSTPDYSQYAQLSPFELRNRLLAIASSDDQRLLLNAGRGNPNFLATLPRRAFLTLGAFAIEESERVSHPFDRAFGAFPELAGLTDRFAAYVALNMDPEGISFLRSALTHATSRLDIEEGELLFEMVNAFLGCHYPTPPRMLPLLERIVREYLTQELYGEVALDNAYSMFATEGGTAAMTYIFQTLRANHLISPGDRIAAATPIFSPYLEIPILAEYDLEIVEIRMDEHADWQLTVAEIAKLRDPTIKILCLVNPSNPPSTKFSNHTLDEIAALIENHRRDLLIVTDDVYATFADDFVSLFARCPRNTIGVYSFSKYFGATGWRLGAVALHDENEFDTQLLALDGDTQDLLNRRYASLTETLCSFKFMDRLVADSRAVALNHTAGLSTPQQLQMALFALHGLLDHGQHRYKDAAKDLIRGRHQTLYSSMAIDTARGPNNVQYYALIDLQELGATLYGAEFSAWFSDRNGGTNFVFRLAEETGVVLLPGSGFEALESSVRVSLANLNERQYASIGRYTSQILAEYFHEYQVNQPDDRPRSPE